MRKHIPGLHSGHQDLVSNLDGLFLVRVERASYRWHPQKPFFALRFGILEPTSFEALSFSGRLYCTERALWKLRWFLRRFWLRHRTAQSGPGRRKGAPESSRGDSNDLYESERSHLPESGCFRTGGGMGSTLLYLQQRKHS